MHLLAAACAFLVSACASGPEPQPVASGFSGGGSGGRAVAPAPEGHRIAPGSPVTLALLVPQTASAEGAARLGRAIANAAQLGLEDLRNPNISLRVYNTGGQPQTARAVAEQALREGADLFLGPLFAANTEAVGAVAAASDRKVISFSTITAVAGDPVSLIGYSPEAEARRVLSYAAAQGRRDVAVFYPGNDYGEAAVRGAQSVPGVQITAVGDYERSFKSIEENSRPFAQAARELGATSVFLPAGGKELQAVASFVNYHGLDPQRVQYVGLGQWNSRATLQEPSLQGGWFPAPDPDAFARFAGRYRDRFGEEPPLLATLGHTAVQVAGQLLASAAAEGRDDPFSAARIVRPQGFRGTLGPLRILPDGTSEHAMAILEVSAGRFVTRDPAPLAIGAGS
ncbi:penicillin-binding protein activator [Paralimibaculum aggregatum]|uniref:penicillin-binding protein activator n=1 Tax=Paralimibaculum aggregatum TaxID=3036245 RepID=UPI002555E11B|nr:penicillin-binding protein activator [Limibaculum sp. NKW23]